MVASVFNTSTLVREAGGSLRFLRKPDNIAVFMLARAL